MAAKIFLIIFYLFFPMLILYLCRRVPMINKLGSVVIAYAFGIVIGNISILPPGSDSIQEILTIITVPVAIPLLLFSANIKAWYTMAGKTFLSLLVALIGVILVVSSGYLLFRTDALNEMWKVSGMLVGVYTGGTPNLASLKMMLNVDPDIYIITHTYDMILSSIYLLFLITIGRAFFRLFLPPYPQGQNNHILKMSQLDGQDPYHGIFRKKTILPLLKALGISVVIFGVGGVLSLLFPENAQMVVVILVITTLGILMSMIPFVNRIEKTFELGNYFILIFSLVVASMADISDFSGAAPNLFYYISYVVFGGLLVHILLASFLKIDTDTVMVTSTALVCSPPFVPVIASAIRNREVIISGLTVGILGYAIGNYLGYFIAQFIRLL